MAVYTPTQLLAAASWSTTTLAGATYSAPSATTGIIRTIQLNAQATSTFTVSLGADAAGTRIFGGYALTASVASIFNGWWVTAANSASAIQGTTNVTSANSVIGTIGGYAYS